MLRQSVSLFVPSCVWPAAGVYMPRCTALPASLLVFSSPCASFLSLQVAGQYVGEDRQLQRTLVQAMLLAGELSLGQEHMLRFGLQVGQGQKARRDAVALRTDVSQFGLAFE